ncbi:DMT family transporter [Actinopolymorpha singaporensis]|uniref:Transporter family-2 protein n=1 Tax=Actinopolymorpha singaporensis TaxID=117157 RepID=A0A1H1LGB3_9ACTN|nr:DMT family transporter [Actinopolymorpha singaporensis]SDR73457.1 transporter family-2 protein [Actinopolymorpha singaporensis]
MTQTRNSPTGTDQHAPPAQLAVGIAITFVIGVLLACQSRVNGQLGSELHDGIVAATWSFGSGLAVLVIVAALVPGMRSGLRSVVAALRAGRARSGERDGRGAATASPWALRPWQVLGGVCGAYLVVTQSATVGLVGVAVFTVAVVAGQAGSSLVVDRLGLGPGGRQPVTTRRMVGAVLALGAVVLTVSHQLGTPSTAALAILPALAGVGTAWQQAVNGRVARAAAGPPSDAGVPDGAGIPGDRNASPRSGSKPTGTNGNGLLAALVAALTNFGVGTAALLVAAAVDVGLRGMPAAWPSNPLLYIGGLFGIAFISLAAYVVKITGVLLLGLTSVAGQLVGALVLDAALPTSSAHLTVTTVIGTLLTLVAVGIAAVPARRRPTATSG